MMAAMMLPSLIPAAPTTGAPAFVAGYLGVWTVAGLAGYVVVEGIRAIDLGWLAWDRAGPYVAAGVILAAAAYQLSPVKGRCLRRCQERAAGTIPSRPGFGGALQAGLVHGGYCVGCTWALMAALLALGAMSLVWMAVIAALITAERLLPRRALAATAVAVTLTALGLAVALVPADVPGLTLPGPSGGMGAMDA
jgi:predicted metal-binding membrane protein